MSSRVKLLIPIIWLGSTVSTLLIAIVLLLANITNTNTTQNYKYSVYASKPQVLGASSYTVQAMDGRAAKINGVLERFNCPIQGSGDIFVEEADKYDIPYWLVVSVAFQESSCGKNVAKKDGEISNNLWGWGIHGDNVKAFDDLEHGVSVVSKYMSDRFYSNGVTDLCEIMRTYTPPSNGSWCEGVGYFRDQIINYSSPERI